MWSIESYDDRVKEELETLPTSIKLSVYRILEPLECFANEVKEPHTQKVWAMVCLTSSQRQRGHC